jgi:glycosyltransferase involved in cell wall biosynthesis
MPVFNGGEMLQPAVQSILDQTFSDFELLIIDDGSTDGALDGLDSSLDPRLRVVHQTNIGLAGTLNRGLALAKGEFIARMDCDDVAHHDRLRQQTAYLREHPEVVMVGSQIERFVSGQVISTTKFPLDHENIRAALMRGVHAISHPSVCFRATAAKSVGGYWAHGVAEDWDFFLKLTEIGRVVNIDNALLRYRFHSGGINASSMTTVRRNIALAVANAYRRENGLAELTPDEHAGRLTRLQRFCISAQVRSLTAYRKSLNSKSNFSRIWHLMVASMWWPIQAVRRARAR